MPWPDVNSKEVAMFSSTTHAKEKRATLDNPPPQVGGSGELLGRQLLISIASGLDGDSGLRSPRPRRPTH